MARKCFISFKTEDIYYKDFIQNNLNVDMIDKSLDNAINSMDEEYIMRKIREDYLSDTTVTIHLIGRYSAENMGAKEQRYIKGELQASLYDGNGNTKNGILGVVLPEAHFSIYKGTGMCKKCGKGHTYVSISDATTIREFSYNFYIPHGKCSWSEDDRYCVLVPWNDFISSPEEYIETAFNKRNSPISNKIRVRP